MTTEAALLAAIAANPDDDLPRLVYADWLDKNDRPLRAEFIRLQIEIAKKEMLPRAAVNAFAYLWQRQQEILDWHKDELLGPLANLIGPHDYEFRRGFLETAKLCAATCWQLQEALQAFIPLPRYILGSSPGVVRHVIGFDVAMSAPLTVYDLLTGIRTTDDFRCADDEVSRSFDEARRYPRLEILDIENCRLGDQNIRSLFGRSSFPALVDLDLSFNDLTDAGVIDLLNTGLPQRLKRLVLGGNPIGDQAAMELADRLGRSTVLETLNLRMTNIGRAGQAAITRAFGSRADLF